MRKRLFLICLAILLKSAAQSQNIMGYLQEYQLYSNTNICYSRYSDVTYCYINPTATGNINYTSDVILGFNSTLFENVKTSCTQNMVRLWVSIGGADAQNRRASNLSAICGNSIYRETFVTEVVNFAILKNLTGIDIDWEFPKTSTDLALHKQLVADFRAKINALKPSLKLSISVGGMYLTDSNHLQYLDETTVPYVDFVNVMAYDFPVDHPDAGVHHSSEINGITSLDYWNSKKGVPYSKMRLGIPFYGRGSVDRNANNGGMSFRELKVNNPNAINVNNVIVKGVTYYYNSKTEIDNKINQSFGRQVGGIMVWDMADDNASCDLSTAVWNSTIKDFCFAPGIIGEKTIVAIGAGNYSIPSNFPNSTYTWSYTPASPHVIITGTGNSVNVVFNYGAPSGHLNVTSSIYCNTSVLPITVIPSITDSYEDQLLSNGFVISPNPSVSDFKLSIPAVSQVDLSIYNSLGQLVESISDYSKEISFGSELSQGIYIVKISVDGNDFRLKVIKE